MQFTHPLSFTCLLQCYSGLGQVLIKQNPRDHLWKLFAWCWWKRIVLTDSGGILTISGPFLPMQHYASMGTSYCHMSVCLSVTSWWSIKRSEPINLVFGMEAFFDHCVSWKFRYLQKIGYFPLELFTKHRTGKISPWHTDHRTCYQRV